MGPSELRAWTVNVGVDAFPLFSEHRLCGATVLPGAAVVEIALAAAWESSGRRPYAVNDLRLERVCVIPSSGERWLRSSLSAGPGSGLSLAVTGEQGGSAGTGQIPTGARYATARIEPVTRATSVPGDLGQRISAFRKSATEKSSDSFFADLRRAGVEYRGSFRALRSLWQFGRQAYATVSSEPALGSDEEFPAWVAHPVMIDAAVQMVAAASGVQDRAFVWAGCARVMVHGKLEPDCQAFAWSHLVSEPDEVEGDVVLLGSAGRVAAELLGVRLHLLAGGGEGGPTAPALKVRREPTFAIASTFDVEPLRGRLAARMEASGLSVQVVVEPKRSGVSELTAPGGVLAANRDGVNLLLLRREDVYGDVGCTRDRGGSGKYFFLPEVGEIAHLNQYETEYLYEEIFAREAYLRHGVSLQPDDTVFDVGANIGMFALFAHHRCPGIRVFAFEPARAAFEALVENASRYFPEDGIFNFGISDGDRVIPFTFYRNSTVFSGFSPNLERDERNIRAVIHNVLQDNVVTGSMDLRPIVDRMVRDRG
ncbi:FkbM family methyltransferase [Frankia sp. AgKG'84/4]|nr:FkbM family methyltransferase [Frankia sp. AgKG'84/4]